MKEHMSTADIQRARFIDALSRLNEEQLAAVAKFGGELLAKQGRRRWRKQDEAS